MASEIIKICLEPNSPKHFLLRDMCHSFGPRWQLLVLQLVSIADDFGLVFDTWTN
jgi:hypothetical protein